MSAYPPPIPHKVKSKPFSGQSFPFQLCGSTNNTDPLFLKSRIDVCDTLLDPINLQSLIHHFYNQCSYLKDQDQQLMQLFICIREEVLLLQELGNMCDYNAEKPCPNDQSICNLFDERSKNQYQQSVESVINSYQVNKERNELECSHSDIICHFNTSQIFKVLEDFRQNSDFRNGLKTLSRIYSTKKLSGVVNVSNHHSLPPPIPEKKTKRDLSHECNLHHNSLNVTDELAHSQSLVSDPVLDQCWPRTKSFNSSAFLNHTRKSSMTLSDFYDHLNPISIGQDQDNIICEKSTYSSTFRPSSLNSNTSFSTHKQPILSTSKSSADCKLSGANFSQHYRQNRGDVSLTGLDNFSKPNDHSGSTEIKDSQLIRAGSSPSLSSLSILPKFQVSDYSPDIVDASNATQIVEELNPRENFKFEPTVSKSPKRFFSIISRGLSSGFNKHNGKKQSQKYSHSSDDLTNSFNLNVDIGQIENISTTANENVQKGLSLLSPLPEIPPPIPPKYNKQNAEKCVDLQQTWC